MQYFGRVYRLEVGGDSKVLTLDGFPSEGNAPAQIKFTIDQTPNALISYAEITIYGLSRERRAAIYQEYTEVSLVAGYFDRYAQIFRGNIRNVEIGREGPESYVKLFCYSGGKAWDEAIVNQSFGPNTPQLDIIRAVAETFGLPVEIVGDFSALPRAIKGRTIPATSSKLVMMSLAREHGFDWQIRNNRLTIVKHGAQRPGAEPVIYSPSRGLIGSPQITAKGVDVKVLLDSSIKPFDLFRVEAETGTLTDSNVYHRTYSGSDAHGIQVVYGVQHSGDFYGDDWSTTLHGIRAGEVFI